MKKLPLGIQTFSEIVDGYIYVDKSDIAYDIICEYKYTFLSRPRRFGKSLFVDTLKNIFEANRELFVGLAIEDRYDWSVKYPVISINFAKARIENRSELDEDIIRTLKENQQRLGIECEEQNSVAGCFRELIIKANQKYNQKVVILVDEYDKPILDNIDNKDIAKEIRNTLVNFYSVIKASDEFLRFAFLTGVSKFAKTSLFSGLNNITDITLNPKYGNICGYSQNDIDTTFKEYLKDVDLIKLKEWYNGYSFLKDKMYNPFDILQFISNNRVFKNYWFETGTPSFLVELIKKENYFLPQLANLKVGEELLNSFDIENIKLEVVLFQAGYLTINKVTEKRRGGLEYHLKLPNKEVKQSLYDYIIYYLFNSDTLKSQISQDDMYDALVDKDMKLFEKSLKSMFASIPYNNYTNNNIQNYEGFYATVVYVYLQSLGLDIIGEDVTNKGRIDLTIKLKDTIYIIEFKIDDSNALKQIKDNGYADKYSCDGRDIYLVGIEFDTNNRNIVNLNCENISK
jgi:hypothetical protein